MAETNLTTSYVTRSRYQLSIDSIPRPTGTREDGTFTGLDGDANSRAMVPFGVQPDPVVSQQAIVTTPSDSTGENNANTLVVHRNSYGLRGSASNYARRTAESPTPEVFT